MKNKTKEDAKKNKDEEIDYRKKYYYNNTRDFIIKLILLIIIIILLLHNCDLMKKDNYKIPEPNGNVDIFEIQCSDNGCKDYSNKQDDNKPNKKTNDIVTNNYINNNVNNNLPDNKNITPTDDATKDADIEVLDNNITWQSVNNLRIFTNPVFNMENIVEPESSNTYQFVVRNNTAYNIAYNMKFLETNDYHINMKYKLRRDGNYIAGSQNDWVSYNELSKTNILLDSSKSHTYYLDWKWISSDNDTEAGANSAPYRLDIEIKAVQRNG